MKNHLSKLVRYFFVGGSAAIVNFCVYALCVKAINLHYILGGICAFFVATFWNFIIARKFVFQNLNSQTHKRHSNILKEFILVFSVSAVGLLIDLGTLTLCIEILKINELLAKIIATAMAFIFNFSLRNFVIYK